MVKKKLSVEGMHCNSCAMNIDLDLEDLEGVKKVKTSYAKEVIDIEFDSEKVTLEEIVKQIKKTGYKATAA